MILQNEEGGSAGKAKLRDFDSGIIANPMPSREVLLSARVALDRLGANAQGPFIAPAVAMGSLKGIQGKAGYRVYHQVIKQFQVPSERKPGVPR